MFFSESTARMSPNRTNRGSKIHNVIHLLPISHFLSPINDWNYLNSNTYESFTPEKKKKALEMEAFTHKL